MFLRGLETHSCPPAGRFNTTGSGARPVPVSAQLGGGAAHSARAAAVAPGSRSSGHGVQSTRRTPGRAQAHMQPRGPRPQEKTLHQRSGSVPGWVQLGARLIRAPRVESRLLRGGRHGDDSWGMAAAALGGARDPGLAEGARGRLVLGSAARDGGAAGRVGGGGSPKQRTGSHRRPARGGACSRRRGRVCGRRW
jgi:hypothetical protein